MLSGLGVPGRFAWQGCADWGGSTEEAQQVDRCDLGRRSDMRKLVPKAKSAGWGDQLIMRGWGEGGRAKTRTEALPTFSEKDSGSFAGNLVQGNQSPFWKATYSQSLVEGRA